jgi:hypothetical protein
MAAEATLAGNIGVSANSEAEAVIATAIAHTGNPVGVSSAYSSALDVHPAHPHARVQACSRLDMAWMIGPSSSWIWVVSCTRLNFKAIQRDH